MEINGTEYVNVDTAAKMLEVTPGRVRQLIAYGGLSSLKLTKRLNMIPIREVEEIMNSPRKVGRPKKLLDKA